MSPQATETELSSRLDLWLDQARDEATETVDKSDREVLKTGRIGSVYWRREQDNAAIVSFKSQTKLLAQIIAGHIDDPTRRAAIAYEYANRLAEKITKEIEDRTNTVRASKGRAEYPWDSADDLRNELRRNTDALRTDVAAGLAWGEPIGTTVPPTSQTVINIAANYGNQQIAVGNHNQQTIKVHPGLADLIKKIDSTLASPEFARLPEDQQLLIREPAEDLIEEAQQSVPDASRIGKWGKRLLDRLKTAGLGHRVIKSDPNSN